MAGLLALMLVSCPAHPQQVHIADRVEYCDAYVTGHGDAGRGDGPRAGFLTVTVPEPATIPQENGGTHPMLRVVRVINGRSGIRGHGYPIPVWGNRFIDDILQNSADSRAN